MGVEDRAEGRRGRKEEEGEGVPIPINRNGRADEEGFNRKQGVTASVAH
jgi:hypothetical protein